MNAYILSTMLTGKLPHLFFHLFYILKSDLFLIYFIVRFLLDFFKSEGKF